MSVASSQMSQKSLREEVMDKIREEQKDKPVEWDSSTQAGNERIKDPEQMLASRLANEILEQNPQFKNVHSKMSMKGLLEKEAKKQLLEQGGAYQGPKVATHKEHEKNSKVQASNLPYLHKNPAI